MATSFCVDSGAFFQGYGADITRTIPVNGKFTKRQKEIYELVLKAEQAAIKAVKPGVRIAELDAIARAIIVKAGYGDYFIHGNRTSPRFGNGMTRAIQPLH